MKMHAVVFSLAATACLAIVGMRPAAAQEKEHDHQHQAAPEGAPGKARMAEPATGTSAAKARAATGREEAMDMQAMCQTHRRMMSAGAPAEREGIADREMKGMSAAQRQQHMKLMDEKCQ